jgi:signal transduction histidine kinase
MVLLGGAAAFGLATVLTRPVGRLVRATEAVGRGDFDTMAPVWATDEIGQLGIAFNKMTEQLRESAETLVERNRDLEALNAVASAANRSLDASVVLEASLDEALGVAGASAGWVLVLDAETGQLDAAAQRGLDPGADPGVFARRSTGCACLRDVLAEDTPTEVRATCAASAQLLPADTEASDIICVPLRSKGRPVGVLSLLYTLGAAPNDRQRRLLLAIGDQVGVALENARLLAELREKEIVRGQLLDQVITAQEDERKRIARELHDETGQALTSVAVMLKSLDSLPLSDDVRARVADIQAVAASAVRAVHDLAFELRPSVLDDAGLAPAIERYGREFGERHQIAVDVQVTGIHDRLPAPIETALYRITQEALTNIARHAQATHASLLLERRNGSVLLLVEDDGRGFVRRPHMSGAREHLGIHGMEERATLVGGKLTIETEEGAGTSVYVEVPVPEEGSTR